MNRSHTSLALGLLVTACIPAPKIAPPRPAPPPVVLAPPPPAVPGWTEAPVNAGGWTYARDTAGSTARFGLPGAIADFELRCDSAGRLVSLSRPGAIAGTMTITTSYGARSFAAAVRTDGRVAAPLPARDPFLDQLAFSRARFAVDGPAPGRLILPAWAEPTRVIEDCRA